MIPSLELRLRSMMRAVTEVILPAIDQNNSLAQEQGRLLVGHLHAMLLQLPYAARLERVEHEATGALAQRLIAASRGGPVTTAATARLNAALLRGDRIELSQAIERLIVDSAEDSAPQFMQDTERLVLAEAKATTLRGRTWFKPMGFDAEPESLTDVASLLEAQEVSYDRP